MANFTDDELKVFSKEVLEQPDLVAEAQLAYDDSFVAEQTALEADQQNIKFFNDAKAVVDSFHSELQSLTGEVRTSYSASYITDTETTSGAWEGEKYHFPFSRFAASGNSSKVPTFPSSAPYGGSWPKLWTAVQPLVLPQNNGKSSSNSVGSSNGSSTELDMSKGVQFMLDAIQNGYNFGSDDNNVPDSNVSNDQYSGPWGAIDVASYNTTDKILLSSGGNYSLVEVLSYSVGNAAGSPVPPAVPDYLYWKKLNGVGAGSFTSDVDFINSRIGFTESVRQGLSIPPLGTSGILANYKDLIDLWVSDYKVVLNNLKTMLQASNPPPPYDGQNEAQIASIDQLLSDISVWESKPSTVPSINDDCRFDDTWLSYLDGLLTARQGSDRATEVIAALGNVTQTPDGAYTGGGMYFTMFLWVDKRINIAEGSYSFYTSFTASQDFLNKQIALQQNIRDEYDKAYLVIQFEEDYEYDSENPTNVLKLLEVNGLSVNDQVKIMDNDSSVFDRIITFVNTATNEIYLDSPITESLNAAGKQARVFKEK
jgi:hypothetical protein